MFLFLYKNGLLCFWAFKGTQLGAIRGQKKSLSSLQPMDLVMPFLSPTALQRRSHLWLCYCYSGSKPTDTVGKQKKDGRSWLLGREIFTSK